MHLGVSVFCGNALCLLRDDCVQCLVSLVSKLDSCLLVVGGRRHKYGAPANEAVHTTYVRVDTFLRSVPVLVLIAQRIHLWCLGPAVFYRSFDCCRVEKSAHVDSCCGCQRWAV